MGQDTCQWGIWHKIIVRPHPQFITMSYDWNVSTNNGNTFLPSGWLSAEKRLWDLNNGTFYPEETVLKEHAAP